MTKPVALITNALAFAGPPAVDALLKAGFQVVVHDVAFISSQAQANYRSANPEVVVLPDQAPVEIIEFAWAVSNRLDVLVSNDAYRPIHGSRAGANALIKSLSIELAPHNIPVNAIAPNYLYSETYYPKALFVDDAAGREYIEQVVPAGRLGRPEEIGELIHYLATMQGTFMTGSIIDFAGGWPVATQPPNF